MKTSEKLLQKLKTKYPKECSHITKLYLCYGISDGVGFCWSTHGNGSDLVFSYNTMTECLKKEITLEPAIFNGNYNGYIVGVVDDV